MLGTLRSGVLDLREVDRFANEPVREGASLHWDLLRLWLHMQRALEVLVSEGTPLDSIGVDTWGCDYGLLDERGELLGNPFHYRDPRTDGVTQAVFARVPRARIYDITGIQFLSFNTLYQLYAACQATPRVIAAAAGFGTIADILNYWLTGELRAEFTNATTTQMIDARSRSWARDLLAELSIPTRFLPPLTEPGTVLGPLVPTASRGLAGTPVVAPACHDTGSAVASVPAAGQRAFLSSGTWSLLGTEVSHPIISSAAHAGNFTNEGGVGGTTRLLKNIGGLWMLQACRSAWARHGHRYEYTELIDAASDDRLAFAALFDPDDPGFLHPENMVEAIAAYCTRTGQAAPATPAAYTRAILESLAFKYRVVLDSMEELIGYRLEEIRIIGGGSKNKLLNQFTANATGRPVSAGPVEATALGNIAVQMMATGAVSSLDDARAVIDRSFPTVRYEPREDWSKHYTAFGMIAAA